MAYLQSELLPSTAPIQRRPAVRAAAIPQRRPVSKLLSRFSLASLVAALFAIPGYVAARETDSLAIGILAADFAFLIAVAGWSTVAGNARR